MLYFRMVTTEDEAGVQYQLMERCEGYDAETIYKLNERLNPYLAMDILANPTQYYFDSNNVLWKRGSPDVQVDVTPPAAPTGLVVTAAIRGAIITLNPNAEEDWDGFEIHASTTSGFVPDSTTLKARGKGTRFDIVDLVPRTTYYFKAIAYDRAGNKSAPSAEVSCIAGTLQDSDYVELDGAKIREASIGHAAIAEIDAAKITVGKITASQLMLTDSAIVNSSEMVDVLISTQQSQLIGFSYPGGSVWYAVRNIGGTDGTPMFITETVYQWDGTSVTNWKRFTQYLLGKLINVDVRDAGGGAVPYKIRIRMRHPVPDGTEHVLLEETSFASGARTPWNTIFQPSQYTTFNATRTVQVIMDVMLDNAAAETYLYRYDEFSLSCNRTMQIVPQG